MICRCVDFTYIAVQTDQVMTSQIKSHIEYLTHTYYIFYAHFVVEIDGKYNLNGGF